MAQINEWIEISNTSGEGDATITLTASTYTELTDRVANLKVSTRTKTAYVNIKQTAFEPSLSLSYNTLVFNQTELQDTTTVTSNVAWTAEPSADWITLSQTSGDSGSTTIIIEVDTIGKNESRTGYITFYYGDNVKTLVVSQAYEIEFIVNPTSVDLSNGARTITITSDMDWTATTTDDWYTLSTTSGASGTSTITLTPLTINVSEDIYGSIDFYIGNLKKESVVVKQLILAENQFYFEPIESFILGIDDSSSAEYKIGDGNWTAFNRNTISSTNERIYVRNLDYDRSDGYARYDPFITSGKCNVGGDITTLLGDMKEKYAIQLFLDVGIVSAENLILPATTLAERCYSGMFGRCTLLTTAPKILPATTLAKSCYESMFYYCYSLTTAPELPATTLTERCYASMFDDCTSLTTAPELPATTLTERCYAYMFVGCTSLTTAPELPATTLAESCYYGMFADCSNLNYIKMLATDISAKDCLYDWVGRVASRGTFVKNLNMIDLPTGYSGIPSGWVVQDNGLNINNENQFYFEPLESFSVSLSTRVEATGEYKIGDGDWQPFEDSEITSTNERIYVRSLSYNRFTNWAYAPAFETSGKCNVGGDITTLLGIMRESYATHLFEGSDIVSAENLILPATTLADSCYYSMFVGCTSLTTAPELPATTLADSCYYSMFDGCTSLTTAPELPATTLTERCYAFMFFGCTSLTTAPELPATTLVFRCYASMFRDCTSLTTAPELPATTLVFRCYENMFASCSNLNYIKMLATDIWAGSLSSWVASVSPTGTFVKNPNMNDLPTGADGIPSGWTVVDA